MIESSNFKHSAHKNECLLLGSRVILCTLSMLSTDKLMQLGITKIVPVQTVIVDEASQIDAGDYLPILARYKTTLRKMIFIGDDNQRRCGEGWWNCDVLTRSTVAPHGQEDVPELRSVFEWPHLKQGALFLDTQCRFLLPSQVWCCVDRVPMADRMPTVIGNFISRHVYDSELRTVHSIHTPTCCRFVDVSNGREIKKGVSWMVRVPDTQIRRLR